MATRVRLDALHRGRDLTQPFTVSGVDLTNAAIVFTAWEPSGRVAFQRLSLAAGGGATQIAITSTTAFEVYIVPSNTSSLAVGIGETLELRYEVKVTIASSSKVYTVADGILPIVGAT